MAKPRREVDREQVKALASIACTVEEIAVIMRIGKRTLERNYKDEIEMGRANFKASLRREQWNAAKKGSAALLIWLGKQHLGQTEKIDQSINAEVTGDTRVIFKTTWGTPKVETGDGEGS